MSPEDSGSRSLLRPALGTLVFVALVPGTVIGWVPWAITDGWTFAPAFMGLEPTRWLGVALALVSLPIFADFCLRFVLEGFGTPAPIAPPTELVVRGTFRYCRNPGYVGVIGLIVGQGLLFGSGGVLAYAAVVTLAFHLFVVFYEEPDLAARFGEAYVDYCRRVPRWIPRTPRD